MKVPELDVRFYGHRRSAFSMIEMTIAASILAIGSAVIVPRWSQSVERTKLTNMRRCLETDVELLRRLSVRRGQQFSLSFTPNSSEITIAPAVPDVLGNAAGVVNFEERFPGIRFAAIDLNGSSTCNINIYGELVSVSTGQALNAGLLTIGSDSLTQTSDLLAAQGLVSTPTIQGGGEALVATDAAAKEAVVATEAATSDASMVTTEQTATEKKNGSSSKLSLQKMFGM